MHGGVYYMKDGNHPEMFFSVAAAPDAKFM